MKNIFYIVIDAFCYDNLERKIGDEYTTPFLRSLAHDNISAQNMYAQAPYTEASLVSLLSGENTLENGGYLFGNRLNKKTVFEDFKKNGYKIVAQYSPYVYSKAYLRDIDCYLYTRLINFEIIFNYRLDYYRIKYQAGELNQKDIGICIELIDEGINTWICQARALIDKDKSCALIYDWVIVSNIEDILNCLEEEYAKFKDNREGYLYDLFQNFFNNKLLELNKRYNTKNAVSDKETLVDKYQDTLKCIQEKYIAMIRRDSPDIKYMLNTLFNNRDGYKDLKGLIRNYLDYYNNYCLTDYFRSVCDNDQTEPCMKRQFDQFLKLVDEQNEKNNPVLLYIQPQDFHLPTLVHSADYSDTHYLENEFDEAIKLCEKIDRNYKGNLVADLGARYCDNKIKELFYTLKEKYGDEFVLIITADHGYPSFFTPPRPKIYNQTYVEAFHIPFIVYNGGKTKVQLNGYFSTIDHFKIIKDLEHIGERNGQDYVLTEYAGPGCPDIENKKLWYTYIDDRYRVSAELRLGEKISCDCIVAVFDLVNDKKEKNNLVNRISKIKEINNIMEIINARNEYLNKKFGNGSFMKRV